MSALPCPSCQSKAYLSAADLTPEGLLELARSEPVTGDTCSDHEYEKRLSLCSACSELAGGTTCKSCGCFVHLRARNKSGHCVWGKW